jgi:predicted RNase H-like nuclease (RuvC/YqgF family)
VTWTEILISIAQVAAGGGVVQAIMAWSRRRQLRQMDRETDSVAVRTANEVVGTLRTELADAKAENAVLKQTLADQQRQIQGLAEQVSTLRVDLAIARAEISRLQAP